MRKGDKGMVEIGGINIKNNFLKEGNIQSIRIMENLADFFPL